jgi:phosphoglycerol transferase MdoB-like AlkP superfamily enzyme
MKKIFNAIVSYVMFWLFFFVIARLFFILFNYREAFHFSFGTLAATFLHGSRLDISTIAYILVIPFLAIVSVIWLRGKWFGLFIKWYTFILIFICSAIVVGDAVVYTYWGYRMDYTVLLYLRTPKEAAASASTLEIAGGCFTVILLTVLFAFLYAKLVSKFVSSPEIRRYRLPVSVLMLLLTAALIIPIRGGTGLAPVNAGTVYFSDDMFINHTAINVVWNAGSSYFNRKPATNPYKFMDAAVADSLTDNLLKRKGIPEKVLNNTRPNIMIFILESFGDMLIGPLGGDTLTTPCLNRYIKESLVFSNFYASGNRTDKALPAILSGYPAQPAASIIKQPEKTQSLSSLVRIMDSLNYQSSFWYGGDINFANFNSYLIATGFHQLITMKNFDPANYNSKWGVHDHILFRALKDSMAAVKQPFFRVVLTLSSHEPFEIPVRPVFPGKDEPTKFRNSVHYADSTLGNFLDWAKQTDWWKNTLIIMLGDHCRRNNQTDLVFSRSIFKIPMIWTGGAVEAKGRMIGKTGSQVDIPVTLLDQLGLKGSFHFGKDILANESNSFAFYTFNEGFAFVTDTSAYIYDHKLQGPVLEQGNGFEKAKQLGKAYLQVLCTDYLER